MSILYICDRCNHKTKDHAQVRTVSLCTDDLHAGDIATRGRIGPAYSVRMLCTRCVAAVQATICEQLPLDANR